MGIKIQSNLYTSLQIYFSMVGKRQWAKLKEGHRGVMEKYLVKTNIVNYLRQARENIISLSKNLGSKNNSLHKKVTVNKMLMTVIRTGCKLKSDGISGEAQMVFLEDRGNFYAKIFINGGLITVHPSTSEQADASVYYHTYL